MGFWVRKCEKVHEKCTFRALSGFGTHLHAGFTTLFSQNCVNFTPKCGKIGLKSGPEWRQSNPFVGDAVPHTPPTPSDILTPFWDQIPPLLGPNTPFWTKYPPFGTQMPPFGPHFTLQTTCKSAMCDCAFRLTSTLAVDDY